MVVYHHTVVTWFSLVGGYQRFGITYRLQFIIQPALVLRPSFTPEKVGAYKKGVNQK